MGNGDCRWWEGSCSVSFASGDPAALLQRKGLAYGGTVVVNLWGAEVVLAAIGDGLFAEWGCSGDLLGLYRRQADGGWEEVDATAKRVALSLNRDLGSRHSSGAQL